MNNIEQKIVDTIDAHAAEIMAYSKKIATHAEPGYFETRTAALTAETLEGLGLPTKTGLAKTGVCATLQGGQDGPCAAVIGELDGIMCPQHPAANPDNGLAHACGHNLQLAAMVGAAIALREPEVQKELCGSVAFFAVPAEEYVPINALNRLKENGIEFCCGKSELIRTGVMDEIDLALTTHVHMNQCDSSLLLGCVPCLGTVSKLVTFHGKAAHAAASPHKGLNALNAASLALSAIGMVRETFQEADAVRIHTNITSGGTALNVVPDTVTVEAMVRASNLPALDDASAKFDRACIGAGQALGVTANVQTLQGYMPLAFAAADESLLQAAQALNLDYTCAQPQMQNYGSTDVGDLAHVMPIVNFTHGGTQGALHSADFKVTDDALAYLAPAKMMALSVYHLLRDSAKGANQILENYHAPCDKDSYTETIRKAMK